MRRRRTPSRRPSPSRRAVLAALALAFAIPAAGQSSQRAPAPPTGPDTVSAIVLDALPPPRQTIRVGIAELTGDRLSDEARVASVTFPRLLYESISEIDERDLSAEEHRAYAEVRLREATRAASSRLQSAIGARDQLLFGVPTSNAVAALAARTRATDAVIAAREVFDLLQSTGPDRIPLDPVLPLAFLADHEAGRLLPPAEDRDGRRSLAVREDLDLVVWGTIEEIEGYLAVDLFVFHRFLDRDVPAGGTIARPGEIGLDAAVVAADLAEVVLGRAHATLEVVTGSADVAIRVNNRLRGFGSVRAPYLRPGTHLVDARVEGRPRASVEVELAAGELRVERIELPPAIGRRLRIQSAPAGANVYADSVWVGRTPYESDFPAEPTIVRLRRDGYLESRFVVDGESPAVVNRALLPDSVNWTEEIRERRDGFYRALTWFVVSVPVTLLLNGGFESVRSAYPPSGSDQLAPDEMQRLARVGNIFYWSSIGGALVNGGLFVNLLISILDYIEVGEGAHNQ